MYLWIALVEVVDSLFRPCTHVSVAYLGIKISSDLFVRVSKGKPSLCRSFLVLMIRNLPPREAHLPIIAVRSNLRRPGMRIEDHSGA